MTAQHTPGPWHQDEEDPFCIKDSSGMTSDISDVAYVNNEKEGCDDPRANAEFIVRACNCHDGLLAACDLVLEEFSEWEGPEEPERNDAARARNKSVRAYEAIRTAVAQARGEG